jgi:hypothetical protein
MEDFSDFKRGEVVHARLAGASVIITVTLLGVSRATVSIYIGIHESWEDNISEEKQQVKINNDRKRSSCTEDCFEKSQNHCSRGDILKTPFSQNLFGESFKNPTSTPGLQLLNL